MTANNSLSFADGYDQNQNKKGRFMQNTVFITGVSSGIGHGIAKTYLRMGWKVLGVSRRHPQDLVGAFCFEKLDLTDFEQIEACLKRLLNGIKQLDLVILNAGMLGQVRDMRACDLAYCKKVMDTNVWSNKVVLDCLYRQLDIIKQVIAISSGASQSGNRGWNAYSLSKSSLNMLVKLYANECQDTHFTAFAPGLVDTAMQDYLCALPVTEQHPSLAALHAARGTDVMPDPETFGLKMPRVVEQLQSYTSGDFVDIRKMGIT